jgi:predicted dehydrogenase
MRVGVIGLGSIGQRHAKNIKALGHSLWLCDISGARARSVASGLDSVAVSEQRAIAPDGSFISDSDAVVICTPASTHAGIAADLLASGYRGPLFVEKPLALSIADAEVFAQWPHAVTQVGYNLRFHADVLRMRALLPDPSTGQFYLDCDARIWPGKAYASMLLECSHEIDLALSFGAVPVDISASVDHNEVSIWFGRSWFIAIRDRMTRYHRQWTVRKRGVEASLFYYSPEELGDVMYANEIDHFLDCVTRHAPTEVPFAAGLAVLNVVDHIAQLARPA